MTNRFNWMSRRDLLSLLVIATGLPALAYSIVRPSQPVLRALQPRRRRPVQIAFPVVNRPAGTYINEKRQVVHSIDAKGRLLGVHPPRRSRKGQLSFDWVNQLKPFDLQNIEPSQIAETRRTETRRTQASPPRADLQAAEAMFEAAALERLRVKDVPGACRLLENGIVHCILLAERQERVPTSVSRDASNLSAGLRLCDLLAGLGARHGNAPYIAIAVRSLESRRLQGLEAPDVASRLKKWKDSGSKWYKDWQTPRKKWAGLPM